MAHALVTGAAGFIGGALTRHLLAAGWTVDALLGPDCSRPALADLAGQVRILEYDGGTGNLVERVCASRPDVVYHLAALFLADHRPADLVPLVQSNLLLPLQLAEAMAAAGCRRLVNTGTSWQHLDGAPYRPVNLYAATKQASEDLLAFHHHALGLSCTTLKLFDTYGPGDRRRKLVGILVEAARSGAPLDLSPGAQEIDLLHAADAAEGFRIAGERLLRSTTPLFDSAFLPGERLTVRALGDLVQDIAGRPLAFRWGGRPYRDQEVMRPCPAEPALAGFQARIALRDGLAQLIQRN